MRFPSWLVRMSKNGIIPAGLGAAGHADRPNVNGGAFRPARAWRRAWLGLLIGSLVMLGACSSLRLAYSQAPTLVYWWLDGYADFDRSQKPQVKAAINHWLAWHRQTQLPQYRHWLTLQAQQMAGEPSGAALCERVDAWDDYLAQALAAWAEPVAALAPTLHPAQWQAIEKQFAKKTRQWRDDYMQADLEDRWEAATDRSIEQTERFYGRLSRRQKAWLASRVRASPWRPDNDLSERLHKQRDTLATLHALAQPGLSAAQAHTLAAAWLQRLSEPIDKPHAQAREAARHYLCEMAADFHRSATPEQRRHLAGALQGWRDDLDSFIAPGLATAP
jgi:hypothetical protein